MELLCKTSSLNHKLTYTRVHFVFCHAFLFFFKFLAWIRQENGWRRKFLPGPEGDPSDDDTESDSEIDESDARKKEEDSDEAMTSESEDEYDDTADIVAADNIPAPRPPRGYKIDEDGDVLGGTIIGKEIMFKWAGAPLQPSEFGWYRCKVRSKLTAAELKKDENKDCGTHWAKFDSNVDHDNVEICKYFKPEGKPPPRAVTLAVSTSVESRGARWVLIAGM